MRRTVISRRLLIAFFVCLASGAQWPSASFDAQHTNVSPVAAQCMNKEDFSILLDLTSSTLEQHFGSPLVTSNNTVIVAIRTRSSGYHLLRGVNSTGNTVWEVETGYVLPPIASWTPLYQPVLVGPPGSQLQRVYFAGPGGVLMWRNNLDEAIALDSGLIAYSPELSLFNNSVFINSGISTNGKAVYFTTRSTGALPSVLVRIDVASGLATFKSASNLGDGSRFTRFPHQYSAAFSHDGALLYQLVGVDSVGGDVWFMAIDADTLEVVNRVVPLDPRSPSLACFLFDDSSASPTIGPDGDVYLGMLGNIVRGITRYTGWLLHFNSDLTERKIPGGFGWDDTAAIVPASAAQNYTGQSPYLLFVKYNDYPNVDGRGQGRHRLALLDPQDFQLDPYNTGQPVMKIVQSILSPTPSPSFTFPDALTEWCNNMGAYDPFSQSVYANNADSYQYRWDLKANILAEAFRMGDPLFEAYTPSVIGPDGAVYSINKGLMSKITCNFSGVTATTILPRTTTALTTTPSTTTTAAVDLSCTTYTVRVASNYFAPASLSVRRGDVISFLWESGRHNVVDVTADPLSCFVFARVAL